METKKWSWKKTLGLVILIALLSGMGIYGWWKYCAIDLWPAKEQKVACDCGASKASQKAHAKGKGNEKAKPKAGGNAKVTPVPKAASVPPTPAPAAPPSALVDKETRPPVVWESPLVDGVDRNYGRAQAEFVPQEEEVVTTTTTFVEGVTDNYESHDHRDWDDYHHDRYESSSYYSSPSQSSFELRPVQMYLNPVPMTLQPVNMSPPATSGGPISGSGGSNGPVNPAP